MKRIRGVRRVEHELYEGWIARDQLGDEIGGRGFRWNSRSIARCVVEESDIFGQFPPSKDTPTNA